MATPTQKALVTSTADAISANTAWAFTLANTGDGAAVGHCAVLILARSGGTSTTNDLSGWNALTGTPTTSTASGGQFYVWTKTLVSGDLGSVAHFTTATSARYAAACLVVDPAAVDISGATETQTSGTVMTSPSVDPTATDGLLVTIFGPIVNALSTPVTWTATSPITEIVDICSNSGTARNATMLVATEALTSGAVTGTRTGTPTGNVQRQTISVVLAAAARSVIGTGAVALSTASASVKVAPQRGVSGLSLSTASVSRKVSTQHGTTAAGFSGVSTPRRVAGQLGSAGFGLSASGTAQKITSVSGRCASGFSAVGTAGKSVGTTGTANLSLFSTGNAKKSVSLVGGVALGLTAWYAGSQHPVRGTCAFVIGSASTPRKVVTFLATNQGFYPGPNTFPGPTLFPGGVSEAVLFDYLTVVSSSSVSTSRAVTGSSSLALNGRSAVGHGVAGRTGLALTTSTSAHKVIAAAGTTSLGLSASAASVKVRAVAGAGGLTLTTTAVAKKAAVVVGFSAVSVSGVSVSRKTVIGLGVSAVGLAGGGTSHSLRTHPDSRCALVLTSTGRVGRYALAGIIPAESSVTAAVELSKALVARSFCAVLVEGDLIVHHPILWGLMSSDDREPVKMIGV